MSGIDPATVDSVLRFHWQDGSDAALQRMGDDGAIVTDKYAEDIRPRRSASAFR